MITKDEVKEIKKLYKSGLSMAFVARKTGISVDTVRRVLNGKHCPAKKGLFVESKEKGYRSKETLCWKCKNCFDGCSWSRSFEPVKGWKAKEDLIRFVRDNEVTYKTSYFVYDCPEFVADENYRK